MEYSDCHMTSLATSLPVAQWLEHPTSVREVMGSIPVGDSNFFFSHARDNLNIPSFSVSKLSKYWLSAFQGSKL